MSKPTAPDLLAALQASLTAAKADRRLRETDAGNAPTPHPTPDAPTREVRANDQRTTEGESE